MEVIGLPPHAVVLAGGPGERFWPLSTTGRPKPFLRLWGEMSLIQDTVARAGAVAGPGRVWVSSSSAYLPLLVGELHADLVRDRLILEPARRDTAAAIGLAALRVHLQDPQAVLIVLPADQFVGDADAFSGAVREGVAAAAGGRLVVLGVRPNRPDTGYGYIQCGEALDGCGGGAREVLRFVEKPDPSEALALLVGGACLWNIGVVIARADAVLAAIRLHMPELAQGLAAIRAAVDAGGMDAWPEAVEREYAELPSTSFDYGVLQRADNLAVVTGEFPWDDVGNWDALTRVHADAEGNHVHGASVALDVHGSVLHNASGDKTLIGFGVEDVAAVVTDRVVVVAPRARTTDWKRMLRQLEDRGHRGLLEAADDPALPPGPVDAGLEAVFGRGAEAVVDKPWGREIWWARTDRYAGKLILVRAGHQLSLQYHRAKLETHLYLGGTGRVEVDGRTSAIQAGLRLTIAPGAVHRVTADTDVTFVEVSTAELDDVVRIEDRYGRAAAAWQR